MKAKEGRINPVTAMAYTSPLTLTGTHRSVTIPNRVFLAPMAGVSDLPFRLLCHEQGAGLVAMEMVSAKAITYHNRATARLLRTHQGEHPVSLQLFTHEPEVLARALDMINSGEIAEELEFDILDINMGCPVPKITGNGDGSALMKDPRLIEQLVCAAVSHTPHPVTVKIRLGFDEEHRNAVDCALAAEAGGASAVAVHGRTRPQMYSGRADLPGIAAVKHALSIPVFGNGDIVDGPSALRMFQKTGCDAVLVGRAAEGNPWIFREILEYLERIPAEGDARFGEVSSCLERDQATGSGLTADTCQDMTGLSEEERAHRDERAPFTVRQVTPQERKAMILRQTDLCLRYAPEQVVMQEMRKHVAWYIAGFPGASRIRSKVMQVTTRQELEDLLDREMPEK